MSKEFIQEDRYLVVKRSDIQRVLLNWEKDELYRLAEMVEKGRENLNKASLKCVVVESDWPIYNDVWKMVEACASDKTFSLTGVIQQALKIEPFDKYSIRTELSERVTALTKERDNLSVKYGDAWFDGFLRAKSIQCEDGNLEDYSKESILGLSEHAEGLRVETEPVELVLLRKELEKYKVFEVDSPEDIDVIGEEILCFDGCDWVIDYVDVCPEWGHHYMANGTEIKAWCRLPAKLNQQSKV
ncbi:hypothetical protein F0267_25900 [Vibrio coralliilyticus]|uniref:hypothetical protein n=1 Tax=Vibrio TaxID=662 RepID=UPI00148D2D0A|nr:MULTISPECIES: hypothetical protein [Vibrio]NOH26203.1 hypothetical protein [Vibrio europaeus]NOH41663.1 hypothetical protein [Vibrio coralliilyticus]